jgi:hypothetical protein
MPAGPQRRTPPQERHAYGLTILHPSHPEVRRLQQDAARVGSKYSNSAAQERLRPNHRCLFRLFSCPPSLILNTDVGRKG